VTLLNVLLGGLLLLKLILWRQGRWSAATRWAQFTVGLLAIVVIGVTLSTAGALTIDAEWFRARGGVRLFGGACRGRDGQSDSARPAVDWVVLADLQLRPAALAPARPSPAHPITL
jgi:hypothetical protein